MDGYQLNFNDGFVNVNSQSGEYTLAGLSVRPATTSASTHPITSASANRALNVINTNGVSPIGVDVYSESTSTGTAYGVNAVASSELSNGTCVGVNATANGNSAERVLGVVVAGVRAMASDGYGETFGVFGDAAGESQKSYGVFGRADGTGDIYGVYGTATGGAINYGVYGIATGGTTNRAGYFAGDLETTAASVITSDRKFKQNVSNEKSALELLERLRPVTYNMKTGEFPQFNFSERQQHGFIAQELAEVLPELVHDSYHPEKTDASGNVINEAVSYKSVNYTGLISINTQAINELNQKVEEKDAVIKEQEKKIEDLNTRLAQLENCLSALLPALCQMNQSAIEQNTAESQQALKEQLQIILSDKNTIVLTQNVPNPFAEETVIEYNIPVNVVQAQIHFYDAQGKLIQSVDVTTRGNGELKVFANDLSKGTYSYNLVADGKIVASKKMVKM